MRNDGRGALSRTLSTMWSTVKGPVPLLVFAIVAFGWLSIWSASWKSGEYGEGQYLNYYLRQLVWILVGLAAFFAVSIPHYLMFRRAAWWIYLGAVVSLLLVFLVGASINGSRRWIVFGPIQVQPSEFAKVAVVIALANWLMYRKNLDSWWRLLPPVIVAGIPLVMILKQPDLGTCLLIVPVTVAMLFSSGASVRHLGIAAAAGAVIAVISPMFLLQDYQVKRVRAFIDQGSYSNEQKIGEAYQLIQSKVAVGSGGVAGQGWRQGTQNMLNFTPFRHTDFIFAVVGEEWGFLGASLLLAAYMALFGSALWIAAKTREPFGRQLVIGLTVLLAMQVFINIAMTIGLAPVTGLTLPFVSYGGSSMVVSFIIAGLITNVGMRKVVMMAG